MTTQSVIVIVIVAAAAGYVLTMIWKQISAVRAKKRSCGDDCGCDQ